MKKFNKIVTFVVAMAIASGMAVGATSAATLAEQDAAAKARYNQARQTYLNEVNAYKAARQNFANAKVKFQKLKNAENKTEYEAQAKEFLKKSVSALIKYLEAVRTKAENVRGISDEDRTNILADIDKDINWLKEEQTKLDTVTAMADLKVEATAITNYWPTVRTTFKKAIAEIWIARVNYLIGLAEDFSAKVTTKIQDLKAVGKDTAKLEAWQKELNQKIDSAKAKKLKAEEQLPNISNVNADQMFKSIHQFVVDADQYMRKAHSQLVQIVQELRKIEK